MELTPHSPDPKLNLSGSTDPATDLRDLEVELDEARAELAQYQALLQELPSIYEDKFRQQVRSTAQNIRDLLDERKSLQEQVSRALAKPTEPQRLAAASEDQPVKPSPRRNGEVSLPSFLSVSKLLPSFRTPPLDRPISPSKHFPLSWGLAFVFGGVLVGTTFVAQSFFFKTQQQSSPVRIQKQEKPVVSPKAASSLKLVARGGKSWVLIESLGGRKLLDIILEDGEQRTVAIGSGLRIRSGRPDLLFLGIGPEPLKRLGGVSDIGWNEIRQPT